MRLGTKSLPIRYVHIKTIIYRDITYSNENFQFLLQNTVGEDAGNDSEDV